MSLLKSLSFRIRSRGYNPSPVPIALRYDRLLRRRDITDQRIGAIDKQIEWCQQEIRRLEECRRVAGQQRDKITADIKAIRPW